jgi:hypothetical protein
MDVAADHAVETEALYVADHRVSKSPMKLTARSVALGVTASDQWLLTPSLRLTSDNTRFRCTSKWYEGHPEWKPSVVCRDLVVCVMCSSM